MNGFGIIHAFVHWCRRAEILKKTMGIEWFHPGWELLRTTFPGFLPSCPGGGHAIFYCKYWCLSSRPVVLSRRDESKCHKYWFFWSKWVGELRSTFLDILFHPPGPLQCKHCLGKKRLRQRSQPLGASRNSRGHLGGGHFLNSFGRWDPTYAIFCIFSEYTTKCFIRSTGCQHILIWYTSGTYFTHKTHIPQTVLALKGSWRMK